MEIKVIILKNLLKRIKKTVKEELVNDSTALENYLKNNEKENENFKLNQRLMDFRFVPEEINQKMEKILIYFNLFLILLLYKNKYNYNKMTKIYMRMNMRGEWAPLQILKESM